MGLNKNLLGDAKLEIHIIVNVSFLSQVIYVMEFLIQPDYAQVHMGDQDRRYIKRKSEKGVL